ncbi:MAG TPA: hypothetical protein VMZ92_03040 [Planctomycetota bacterium]|nr:hypothetical protein [Planctomycetota bacterium]
MARTLDPHAATVKAWETRRRAMQAQGSSPTQIRDSVSRREPASETRTFSGASPRETAEASGYDLTLSQIADLSGAPPGSHVKISVTGTTIGIETTFPGGIGSSIVAIADDTIHNMLVSMLRPAQGRGIGTAGFVLQAETASKLGFREIKLLASGPDRGKVGYYVWARLGFQSDWKVRGPDGPIMIQDLMRRPGGAAWWKENGKAWRGTFDLSPDSTSMRVLREYRRLKDKDREKRRG